MIDDLIGRFNDYEYDFHRTAINDTDETLAKIRTLSLIIYEGYNKLKHDFSKEDAILQRELKKLDQRLLAIAKNRKIKYKMLSGSYDLAYGNKNSCSNISIQGRFEFEKKKEGFFGRLKNSVKSIFKKQEKQETEYAYLPNHREDVKREYAHSFTMDFPKPEKRELAYAYARSSAYTPDYMI